MDQTEQRDQVDMLVRSTWTLRRLAAAEAQVWIYQMEHAYNLDPHAPLGQAFHNCDRTLARFLRIVNSTQRKSRRPPGTRTPPGAPPTHRPPARPGDLPRKPYSQPRI